MATPATSIASSIRPAHASFCMLNTPVVTNGKSLRPPDREKVLSINHIRLLTGSANGAPPHLRRAPGRPKQRAAPSVLQLGDGNTGQAGRAKKIPRKRISPYTAKAPVQKTSYNTRPLPTSPGILL